MAQLLADRRDVDFVLHEQLEVDRISKHDLFADFNRKTVDLIVSEARNLAIKEILPTREVGDKHGTPFDKGQVTVPAEFHPVWDLFKEGDRVTVTGSSARRISPRIDSARARPASLASLTRMCQESRRSST